VLGAPVVALVFGVGPVVDAGPPVAARPAAAELGIEGVERLAVDAADREVAELIKALTWCPRQDSNLRPRD
jgi:hypothetical protein